MRVKRFHASVTADSRGRRLAGYGRSSVPVMLFEDCLLGDDPGVSGLIRVQLAVAASGQPKKPSRATVALSERSGSIAV